MNASQTTSLEQTNTPDGGAFAFDYGVGTRESLRTTLSTDHKVLTSDGIVRPRWAGDNMVRVDMGLPVLESDEQLRARLQALLEEAPTDDESPALEAGVNEQTLDFLELLAGVIENRDPDMRGHARRVSLYSGLIAEHLKLEDEQREQVRIAAFLHDIGKLGLTTEAAPAGVDVTEGKEHSELGEELMRTLAVPKAITDAVRHHHDRWDGKGHPDQLSAERIPLLARVVAVADAFDALMSNRTDSPSVGCEAALRELRAEEGSRFDPQVVGVLCEIVQTQGESHSQILSASELLGNLEQGESGDFIR